MGRFLHHPDGRIHINTSEVTLEEFLEEHPDYELPEGFTGQEYVQGKFHRVFNERDEDFLEDTWENGDTYISEYSIFKDKEQARKQNKIDKAQKKYEEEMAESEARAAEINRAKDEVNDALLAEIDNIRKQNEKKREEFVPDTKGEEAPEKEDLTDKAGQK